MVNFKDCDPEKIPTLSTEDLYLLRLVTKPLKIYHEISNDPREGAQYLHVLRNFRNDLIKSDFMENDLSDYVNSLSRSIPKNIKKQQCRSVSSDLFKIASDFLDQRIVNLFNSSYGK